MSEPSGRAWSYGNIGPSPATRMQERERLAAESGRRRMLCIGLFVILLGCLVFLLRALSSGYTGWGWLGCYVPISVLQFIQVWAGFDHSDEAGWLIVALVALDALLVVSLAAA